MKRHYTEKEVGALIQRATEIQERSSPEHRLSFDEIEHIAAEIGIDPAHLRTAALELDRGTAPKRRFSLTGGPFQIERGRIVDASMTEALWEQLVLETRRVTGSVGSTSAVGQTREWVRSLDAMEHTHLTVTPAGEQTALQVRKQFQGAARTAYVLAVIFSVTIAGILMDGSSVSDLVLTAVVCLSILTGLVATRTGLGLWSARQEEHVEHLLGRLQEILLHSEAPDAQPGTVGEADTPPVELPGSEDEAVHSAAEKAGRRIRV